MAISDESVNGSELSSRHIPDITVLSNDSTVSLSFQIPVCDNLLADEDESDFFRAAGDISLMTHVSAFSPAKSSPLLLVNELKEVQDRRRETPTRGLVAPLLRQAMMSSPKKQKSSIQQPKLSINTSSMIPTISSCDLPQAESSHPLFVSKPTSVQEPTQILVTKKSPKKEVETKSDKRQTTKRVSLHAHRKILKGGITKSRISTNTKPRQLSSHAATFSTLPPAVPEPQSELTEVALPVNSSTSFVSGITGRPIQYGERYTDVFNTPNNASGKLVDNPNFTTPQDQNGEDSSSLADMVPQHPTEPMESEQIESNTSMRKVSLNYDDEVRFPTGEAVTTQKSSREQADGEDSDVDDRTRPLTLAHLSPRKRRAQNIAPLPKTTLNVKPFEPRPFRTRSKRLIPSDTIPEEPKLKRSKSDETKSEDRARVTILKRRIPSERSRKPGATHSQASKKSSSISGSTAVGIPKSKIRIGSADKHATVFKPVVGWNDEVNVPDEKETHRNMKLSGSGLQNSRAQRETKRDDRMIFSSLSKGGDDMQEEPVGDSQSRSTSRSQSTSSRSQKQHKFYHPVPNFKAIHAAFDASKAHRKENIHPTVPLPMRWETESRMLERKKFDEKVREREREKEKVEEERRLRREAEEEEELKALRKTLVNKAHEVPEWYKERPRTNRRRQEQET